MRNKEIAAELFLSMRTVESHMSKALRKLGPDLGATWPRPCSRGRLGAH